MSSRSATASPIRCNAPRQGSNPGHSHQPATGWIGPHAPLNGPVEGGDLIAHLPPGLEERPHDQPNLWRAVDQRLDMSIEPLATPGSRQQAECLEDPADQVAQPRAHADQLGSGAKQRSGSMGVQGLHVHGLVPAGAHHLRQAFRVILIGLVEPHLQRGFDPPGVETFHLDARLPQAVNEPGHHRPGLDSSRRIGAGMAQNP
jgi:hypothetical protein